MINDGIRNHPSRTTGRVPVSYPALMVCMKTKSEMSIYIARVQMLREIVEEAVRRKIEVGPPPRKGMNKGQHWLMRKWIGEIVEEWKGGNSLVNLT